MCQLLRFLRIRLEQVRHLENQIHRPLIADPHLLMGTEPVKHRQAGAQMGTYVQQTGGIGQRIADIYGSNALSGLSDPLDRYPSDLER